MRRDLCDAEGSMCKWFGTCTGTNEQKQTEQAYCRRVRQLKCAYQDPEDEAQGLHHHIAGLTGTAAAT